MKVFYYVKYDNEVPVIIFKFVTDNDGGVGYRYEDGEWVENSKVFDIRMDGSADYDSYCEGEIDIDEVIRKHDERLRTLKND